MCILPEVAKSAHIIGGEMYYECLGYGNNGQDTTLRRYKITIKLYRDCASTGAQFDDPLGFTIYRQVGNNWVNAKTSGSQEFTTRLIRPVMPIAPPVYPCLVLPPGICGEAGVYQQEVELPIRNEKYLIVWQRCCRNNTITNILDPESTGATFSIEIHPEAQRTCNNSPQFINFPPTVLCVNAPFKFDHSAFDKEGDLLIYQFCEPLEGGGRMGGSNCQSVVPNPDCPPPYAPVSYRFPFTALFPLGGNPLVTINTANGIIAGKPDVIGQFVVGVCVHEYRNGVLLSVLRRDFQFNVASCDGVVEARLTGASQLTPDQFSITVCGTDQYQVLNSSIDRRFINEVLWTYENGGGIDSFLGWAPLIKFKEGGVHNGRFILNPGTNCGDTGYFKINVIPDLEAQFSANYDSCKAGPVKFNDLTTSSYSAPAAWNWSLGDGFVAFTKDPEINYLRPGTYPVLLTITDNFGCTSQTFKEIKWYPSPDVIIFSPNKTEGCVPLDVEFKNISFPTDNSYKFIWRFSDGTVDSGYTVNHRFDPSGIYGLKLEVTSPLGCYNERLFNDIITVSDPPVGDWSIDKTRMNIKDAIVNLMDLSPGTIGRSWIINNNDYYFDKNLQLVLQDTGYHHVRMIAVDKFLCSDTLDADLFVFEEFNLFLPNAFTPNGDGKNDVFAPVCEIKGIQSFSMQIFDRWGSKLFSSSDPLVPWNGKLNNDGRDIPSGVYVCEIKYKLFAKPAVEERLMISLVR